MKLVLEQRYLFDGSVAATVPHAFGDGHHLHGQDSAWAGVDAHDAAHTALATPPAISEPHVGDTSSPETVLFVDPRVADWQELVAGVKPGVDVIMLDPNQDGISQVTQALAGLTNVKNIEFLTDGTPGSITLGGTTLDAAVLGANTGAIAGWSAHLAANADIVFWGCDVGQGSVGAAFISDVHTLTGATVGASSQAVGAAALGGSWALDASTGPLHRDVNPFTRTALAGYDDVLDTPIPTVGLQVTDGTVTEGSTLNLGDTVTVTIDLQNTAENAAGQTPYVEVFVPNGVTLAGPAIENGVALTELTPVTIANGIAINPFTHQAEQAPDGITSGTMYVFETTNANLPAGALAPILVNFTLPTDSSLANSLLTIGARGGFADGSVLGSGANIEGDTFSSTATLIVPLDPSVSIIGLSNDTGSLGTIIDTPTGNTVLFDPTTGSSGSPLDVVPGDIVRMRIVDQLPANTTSAVALQMTLPSGLTYENDGSTTIALVSPSGNISTSTSLGSGIQITNASADLNNLSLVSGSDTSDPVTAALNSSAISATSVGADGQTVTFNLGTLTTHDASATYVVLEFNAVVGSSVANNTNLSPQLATVSGTSNTATQTVATPGFETSPGGFTPGLLGVLDLPMFDASLGTLTQMNLTLTGKTYSTGSFTPTQTPSGGVTFSTKTAMSMQQDVNGPTLPNGTPTIPGQSLVLSQVFKHSTITVGTPLVFTPTETGGTESAKNPYITESNPKTASTTASVTTNLSGFEAVGGGTVPVDVYSNTTTTISSSGGNFSEAIASYAEASISVSYTYTSATSAGEAFLQVHEPTVTLTKAITGISYSGTTATVTYVDTIANTSSSAPAYGLSLTDTGDGNASDTITDLNSHSGSGSGPTSGVTGGKFVATLTSLPANGTETFSYTETVPVADVATSVTDSKTALATVTSEDLNPALFVSSNEAIAGSTEAPPTYSQTASAPFDSISGTVNQDSGATEGGLSPLVPLSGETVTVSYSGPTGTDTIQTDSSGDFTVLVPDGVTSVTVSATVGGTLATAVLDNHPSETGTPSPLPLGSTATETGFESSNTGAFTFTPVSGSSYSNVVFDFWKAAAVSTPTATLSVVGGSNETSNAAQLFDPSGQTSPGVLMTDGEIVRERATLNLTAGTANTSSMTVTLPTNLTFDNPATSGDSSVTVLLVSSDGAVTTSLTGSGLQLTDASPNAAKLNLGNSPDTTDPVTTVLPNSDISVSGNQVTFNLGNLKDLSGSYSVIVEFNAIVSAAAPTGTGNALNTQMFGTVGAVNSSTVNDYVYPQAPTVTLAKSITGISYSGTTATVTYVDTVSNSSGVTAYGLTLTDTGDGNNPSDTISYVSDGGTTTNVTSAGISSNQMQAAISSLATGTSVTFTYTEQVPSADVATSVVDSQTAQAKVVYEALNPSLFVSGKETLVTTTETPPTYNTTALAPFDSISGTVNQDTGATENGDSPLVGLSGETVVATYTGHGGSTTVTTDSNGNFTLLVPDGLSSISLAATAGGKLTSSVLDNHVSKTGVTSPTASSPLPLSSAATEIGYDTSNTGSFSFTPVAGNSYSGIVYDFWQPSTPTPTLTVVGSSNDTAGLGTLFDPAGTTSPGVAMTDGEIVRERATLNLTAGSSDNTSMTVTLPSNLAFDSTNDGSVTVLLVSADGSVTTSLTGSGLQLTDASPNAAKLDLGTGADTTDVVTTALPSSDVSVSGNKVTFTLGNLNDIAGNYSAIVEFNAVVSPTAPTGPSNVLQSQMTGSVNASSTSTVSDYVEPQAPTVTLAKAITGISYSGSTATVTYVDTVSNSSGVTAYGLTLTDTGDGNTSDTLTPGTASGTGTGVSSVTLNSGEVTATMTSLASGSSETFSYTETIPAADVATSVADSKTAQAEVVWRALTNSTETLVHTSVTATTANAEAVAPLVSVSGTVNQDTGATEGGLTPLVPLSGESVSLTYTGQTGTESVTTDGSGDFTMLAPGGVTISVTPTVGTPLVLDNHPDTTGSPTLPSASTTGFESSNAPVLTFTPTTGTSYTGIVFDFWQGSTPTPSLSVVGSSNDTAGFGTLFDPSGQSSPGVAMTDGEIVRERATLNLTAGSSDNTSMTVTLPSNLTFDSANDGSVTVLLVSSNGAVSTSLTGSGLQLTDASPNAAKLDLGTGADTTDVVTTVLPSSDVSVSGNKVTFTLGNLNDLAGNYSAIVEFNAVVSSSAPTGPSNVLQSQMTGSVNGASTSTVSDYVEPQAPTVTLAKAITGISYSGTTATVTYVDTISNSSGVTAYGLTLTDTGDGNNPSDTISYVSDGGTTTNVTSAGISSSQMQAAISSLATGTSVTFTYTEQVPSADVATSVADSKTAQAEVVWRALTNSTETLVGTSVTATTSDQVAVAPFDSVSGNVNQDLSPTEGSDTSLQGLPSQAVAVTYSGQSGTETVSTASDGSFSVLVPTGDGPVTITATTSTPNAPAGDVMDNMPSTTGSPGLPSASTGGYHANPGSVTFSPAAGTSYTGVAFDFWAASTPTATLSVVGGSNDTAGLGTLFDPNGQTSPGVLMTDGEIVRERATLNLTAGSAGTASMTVTLPSNLTFDSNYATDNSVTVLLVSTDGKVSTSLTGSGLQLTDASPNAAKLDLGTGADTTDVVTTVLPSSDVSVSGNKVTFTLGNLSDPSGSYAAIVEFNAVVNPATTSGSVLNTQLTGTANSTTTAVANDYVNPVAPTETLTKTITGFSTSGSTTTVTYVDTITSTTNVTAYGLTLTDPGDGNTSDTITDPSTHSGNGSGASSSVTGGNFVATLTSLPGNGSESFTYTETIPTANLATSVADSQTAQAQVVWRALTTSTETLVGTSVTATTADTTAMAPFSLVSGTVNQDTGSTEGGLSPLTPLPNETVVISFPGGSETVETNSNGQFSALIPGGVVVSVTPTVDPTLVLDNHPDTTGSPSLPSASTTGFETTNSPTLTFNPATGTSYTGLTFDFWKAPTLYNPPSNGVTPALFVPEVPLIPQLALVGSVENRFIIEDQQTVIQVPPDIFVDSDPNQQLVYDAKLPDGTPLPSWLHFDANNLTFEGTPPLFSRGRIEITITAKDQYGNTAEASFSILIGQKEEDLSKLLLQSNQEPGTFVPYGFRFGFDVSDATPVPSPTDTHRTQVADATTPHPRDVPQRGDRWHASAQVTQRRDAGGFTAALRNAGHIGALSRARALLDGLDKLTQARPSI